MNRYLALQKILETGSFSKAAEALGYTQSSVSQMINSLESELGITLLNRSRTGVSLTIEGKELYPFIEHSLLQYRTMQEKAAEIRGLETGIIRVGTISSITCHWMPGLIKGFQKLYPQVQFIFHQGDYTSIQEWIKTGAVDFGFVSPNAVQQFQTIPVKEGEMLAILPQEHPLAGQEKIRLEALATEPFILLEEGRYNEMLAAFEAAGISANVRYTVHDDYSIMMMVEAGLGVSILAELVLRRTQAKVVCKPIDPPIFRTIGIAYKDKDSLPIASKYFIQYILKNIEKLP